MKTRRSAAVGYLLAVAAVLGCAQEAGAQFRPGESRRYIEFKIDRTAEEILKERQELDGFKELLKKIAADPNNFDPAKIKEYNLDNPEKKKAMEDWLRNNRQLREAVRQFTEEKANDKKPAQVKEFQQDLTKILDQAKDNGPLESGQKTPDGNGRIDAEEDESVGRLAERAMKRAEGTKLGDWLRDSPSWNRAFTDLRQSMNDPQASGLKGSALKDKLGGFDGDAWKLGEGALERLKDLPRPRLDGGNLPLPGLRNIPTPNLGVPGMPDFSGPELPALSTGVIWLLLVLLFLLAGWQALRWSRRAAQVALERARLGPWPVSPEAVATRVELISAFDYLALLTLGHAVQSWNHHAVARCWGGRTPSCLESAQALALLYEQARYTDGAEELTELQRELARRSLVQLKEAL